MTRTILFVVSLTLLSACHYAAVETTMETEAVHVRDVPYGQEKQEMIEEIDRRMNELVSREGERIRGVQATYQQDLDAMEPPVRLAAIDRALRAYGAAGEERYLAAIERRADQAYADLVQLVGKDETESMPAVVGSIENDAWQIAREIGGQKSGAGLGYGFVSGVRELDERVEVTLSLLQRLADLPGVRDVAAIRKAEILRLSREFQHDITVDELDRAAPGLASALRPVSAESGERVGRIRLFRSDELQDHRFRRQDSFGTVIAFQNDRLPLDHKYELIQAARHRVIRGGMIVEDFGWKFDPSLPSGDGRMPMNPDLVDGRFIASECIFPAVNVDHSMFADLHDFQVVYDFKTALFDASVRRILGSISWQVTWSVSHNGQVRVLDYAPAGFDAGASVVANLIDGGGAPAAGMREPNPSDLSSGRFAAFEPAITPSVRDLGNGRHGPIATVTGPDQLRISADGRRYLADNRYQIMASDLRFLSYYDGVRRRYVLRLTAIAPGSALVDLGFRVNDDVHAIDDHPIRRFQDVWALFTASPRQTRYSVLLNRGGALRRLVFDVDGVPASAADEIDGAKELSDELVERLNNLFVEGWESESKSGS